MGGIVLLVQTGTHSTVPRNSRVAMAEGNVDPGKIKRGRVTKNKNTSQKVNDPL